MLETFEPKRTTKSLTVAEVKLTNNKTGSTGHTTTHTYPVVQPQEYNDEVMVNIKASDIRRVRNLCVEVKDYQFPWHELFLGIATILFGGLFGALATGVNLDSGLGIVFYIICPIIGTACFVSYVFIRGNQIKEIHELTRVIEEYIPDPDNL